MNKKGKLFVFEGPDDVGKTTLASHLVEYFNNTGDDCLYYAFPGKQIGTLGRHIYELHHDPQKFGVNSIHPVSLQLLHISAHIDAITTSIIPRLQQGQSVVMDRFWWSTWVYGLVSGINKDILKKMIDIERVFWKEYKPEMILLITRHSPFYQYNSFKLDKWNDLRKSYEKFSESQNELRFINVTNEGSIQDTLSIIIETINIVSTGNISNYINEFI